MGTETSAGSLIYFVYIDRERHDATSFRKPIRPVAELGIPSPACDTLPCKLLCFWIRTRVSMTSTPCFIMLLQKCTRQYCIILFIVQHVTVRLFHIVLLLFRLLFLKERLGSNTVTSKMPVVFVPYRPDIIKYSYFVVTDKQTWRYSVLPCCVCSHVKWSLGIEPMVAVTIFSSSFLLQFCSVLRIDVYNYGSSIL